MKELNVCLGKVGVWCALHAPQLASILLAHDPSFIISLPYGSPVAGSLCINTLIAWQQPTTWCIVNVSYMI